MKKTAKVVKKTAIAAIVVLSGLAVSAQAAPRENTWYTGAKAGWSHFYGGGLYDGNENFLPNDGPLRRDTEGAGAFVGYQTSPYLGFELGYDWLGRVARKGDNQSGAFKAQGVQVAAKVDYPLSPAVDIYTRLGGMAWRVDADHSNHVNNTRYSDFDTGISPLAAAGLEFALSESVATRIDYQFVSNVGDKHTVGSRPDHTMVSMGLAYRFDQHEKPMPMPITAPMAPPAMQSQRFMLKSDVLFDFNKASLKQSGMQELDNLYSQLSGMGKKTGAVVVIGHTDRIGSQKYNLKLSERRAQSVVDYLISKGIPPASISARGMGKSESITGNECHGIKNRGSLIRCLAPDRRVVIEVAGFKETVVN